MKKLLLLLVILAQFLSVSAQKKPWRDHEMEVRIVLNKSADASRLAAFSYDCDIYSTYALAYLVPAELQQIRDAGFDFSVLKPDLNAWSASFGDALVPPGYYTFDKIKSIADSLATFCPGICKKVVFGITSGQKELAALKISDNVEMDENEAEILFDGGIHGDEVGGSQNVIQFARDLCKEYTTNPEIADLINNREIWLYYCVNPFGRDYMTRENGSGVDINRDYGYMWGGEGSSLGPFSQPESKALRNCQLTNQFVSYTNYHSGTEIISYPWSYRYSPAPDKVHIEQLAQIYSGASGYTSLPYGQGSQIMYLIQGSTKDFNYGSMGSVAWSIEISIDKQPTNPQHYYAINKPAMLSLIENAGYGLQGLITDAITGKPVAASVYVGQNYPCYSDPVVGDFHKYMIAGTYSIRIEANGYEPKTISNVVVNDFQTTTLNVELNPVSSQYGYRVIASRIPAFNAQNPGDEGYTAACLGAPDQVNYSLGRGGYVIIDMQDTITDGLPGSFDLSVYEGDNTPEGYTLYAGESMDGPWTNIGFGTGSQSFNMEAFGVAKARYFMVTDDNNGQANVNDAGFDFDAIQALHPAIPDTIGHISGIVYNAITNLPVTGATVTAGDSVCITGSDGSYTLKLLRGNRELCASRNGYQTNCDTLQLAAGSSYVHDLYMIPVVGMPEQIRPNSLIVSTNPFTSQLRFGFDIQESEVCTARLYDLTGKEVVTLFQKRFPSGYNTCEWNSSSGSNHTLLPGYYVLKVTTDHAVFAAKVIKAL